MNGCMPNAMHPCGTNPMAQQPPLGTTISYPCMSKERNRLIKKTKLSFVQWTDRMGPINLAKGVCLETLH